MEDPSPRQQAYEEARAQAMKAWEQHRWWYWSWQRRWIKGYLTLRTKSRPALAAWMEKLFYPLKDGGVGVEAQWIRDFGLETIRPETIRPLSALKKARNRRKSAKYYAAHREAKIGKVKRNRANKVTRRWAGNLGARVRMSLEGYWADWRVYTEALDTLRKAEEAMREDK